MSYSKILKPARTRPAHITTEPAEERKQRSSNSNATSVRWEVFTTSRRQEGSTWQAGRPEVDIGAKNVREILARAQAEGETIVRNAEAEAENVRQQAYEEGFEAGHTDGTVAARAEALEHIKRIGELARNAAVDIPCILRNMEEALIGLALTIAEKIVYRRLAEDRILVVSMVKGALDSADVMEVMRVRVNPEEIETLRPYWEEQQWGDGRIDLVADPSVQLGGCIIDTRSSVMDAQIDTKLAEIDRALRAELDASAR